MSAALESGQVRARARDFEAGPSVRETALLAKLLNRPTLFDGVTSAADRKARLRAHLDAMDIGDSIAGYRVGASSREPETWRQLFQRLYGEAL